MNIALSCNHKCQLSQLKRLKIKALDSYFLNFKILGDSIEDMMLLRPNIDLLVYAGTDVIA